MKSERGAFSLGSGRETGAAPTKREAQVLSLAAEGLTDKQIGQTLGISRDTVATYWRRLFAKLEASSRTEAIAKLSATALRSQDSQVKAAERNGALLKCLSDPYLFTMNSAEEGIDALTRLLQNLVTLTGGRSGYVAEFADCGEFSHRKIQSWAIAADGSPSDIPASGSNPYGWDRILDDSLESTVLRGGISVQEGQVGIPLILGDKPLGVLALRGDFSGRQAEIVEFLSPVTPVCAAILDSLRSRRDRERAQADLMASRTRLETILDKVSDGVVFIDLDHRLQFVNAAFSELFGKDDSGATEVGAHCADAVQAVSRKLKDPQAFLDRLMEASKRGGPYEDTFALQDGRRISRRYQPHYSDGELDGYICIYSLTG